MNKLKLFTLFLLSALLWGSVPHSDTLAQPSADYAVDQYAIETVDTFISPGHVYAQNEDIMRDLLSIPSRFALDIYGFLNSSLPFSANPNDRLHDLSIVYALLMFVDAYNILDDLNYFSQIFETLSKLKLNINNTFIGTLSGKVYATDNLLLILAYERLASLLAQIGDEFGAETYWNLANDTFSTFIDVFYDTATSRVAHYVDVDNTGLVTSVANYTSSMATGLFTMANYHANDTSTFYSLAYNSINDYIANGSYYFLSDFSFTCYYATLGSGTSTDNFIDLMGNLYMATALLQHFRYQEKVLQDYSTASFFYYQALDLEDGLISSFKDASRKLLVSGYNVTSSQLSNVIYTYDNLIALAQYVEYYRLRYEFTFSSPDYAQLLEIYSALRTDLIPDYNAIYGGELTDGTPISIDWQIDYLNPLVLGYSATDAFLKLFPLRITAYIPGMRVAKEETFIDLTIHFDESTGIFGSSPSSLFVVGDLEVTSTTGLNISAQESIELTTTRLDYNQTNIPSYVWYNFTADMGGSYSITVNFYVQGTNVMDNKVLLSFLGQLGITTDPNNIAAIEGLDEDIYFAIFIHDELGYGISSADVNVTIAQKSSNYKSDVSGYVYVSVPIRDLLPPEDTELQSMQSSFNATVIISAAKKGYLTNGITKLIKITRNSLVLTLSPSPPTIKEGSDLTLYVSVAPQIQANVYNPKARFYLDGTLQTTDKGTPIVSLPNTVTLKTSSLKQDAELAVYVTSDNFRPAWFNLSLTVQPLGMIEKIYQWISNLLNSTWAQVLGSLGVVWVVLWYRIRLLLGLSRRCPYCGEITKSKKPVCKNCGRVIDLEKYRELRNAVSPKASESMEKYHND